MQEATSFSPRQSDDRDLVAALERVNVQPLWDRFKTLMTREPAAPDAPFLWPWKSMLPMIDRASAEVRMEDAERRVLLLVNPAFGGKVKTTTNLNAALQILGPHEHAHEHRHRLSAIRLILEGNTATTTVNGEHVPMSRGDLILTPAMCWHGHVNHGEDRMVWLDGLDLPLALFDLGVVSFEPGAANEAAASPPASLAGGAFAQAGMSPQGVLPQGGATFPLLRYPWESMCRTFESMPAAADGSKTVRYTHPVAGGAVMPTIDCYALELSGNAQTVARRTTHNAIVAVLEGEGTSRIGSTEIRWQPNDVFTIPHWNWASHRAEGGNARLFMMTDREVLARLGYLVEEAWA
ncbi:cupin domain-containing protein [Ralstonia nicotianae]|uniref:Cupin domain-containing protein n=1 Tax=Ralstonia nicotianae TaxID=3037696 RepID=A0ABX8A270_9RALS|nr:MULTISPECIES: cupin domain-containing protein [Ralstonia solanacearum species complex]MCK4124483.1 cupin domain-containing protein [Ralstonia pseudosolanacearum]MDO3622416.1 cupin domain-containing protein [Ralstonia pseudosolanacearum]QIK21335.1 cupin domain-containing protein [Ralstonia solanacearum]QUP61551.1 cupin domain-containing protein [Ralstonia nicotianae]